VTVVISTIDEPGSVIGEIAPLAGGERIATVTAAETTRVLALAADEFDQLLADDPALAAELSAGAVRRAEEAELVQLLGSEFSLTDPAVVAAVRDSVVWVRLTPGEILFHEGDEPDSVYLVIRGGLQATSWDEIESTEMVLGHIGRGEIVGEVGLLGKVERTATITALRSTVLARIPAASFQSLIDSHPRLMIEVGLAMTTRGRGAGRRTRERVVLAVVVGDRLDQRGIVSGVAAELARVGSVEHLWPEKVDAILGSEGIAGVGPGVLGDVRLGRLLSETELAADHLLLDVSRPTGSWAARALAMADRVLIVVPPDPSADELKRLEGVLAACPSGVPRTVAIMHPATTSVPANTASLVDRFKGTDVLNLGAGDAEVGRLARTVVGRAFGLVLGGGGARGFAHLGVYRALRESGVEIDVVAGSSIGSILAAVMADALPPEDLIELAQRRFANVLDYTIPVVSLIKGDRIAHSIRVVFGDRHIEDLWRPFACVSTDLTTSRSHLHRRGPLVHALRASSSIPGVMPPVPHGDHLLVDGGVLDNLPVDLIRRLTPNGEVVAVDVAPVRGPEARRDFGLSVSGWQAVRAKRGRRMGVPRITAVLMRSMIVASQRERDHQIADGLADLYLDLDLRGVSMLDFSDVAGVAQRGYEAAMPRLEEWLRSRGDQ
jgi:predicted acylesterase/phospholipase RssA/CRP-like cAMP-binding protein